MRAWLQQPELPLVNLSVGIACLHQGMQRTTLNRHLQVLQGFAFLFRYFTLSGGHPEAHYNVGRAFQTVGTVATGCGRVAARRHRHPTRPDRGGGAAPGAVAGLHALAAPYYEHVLATAPDRAVRAAWLQWREYPWLTSLVRSRWACWVESQAAAGSPDLRREAAWNLSLLHVFSGSPQVARELVISHCAV